MQVDTLPCCGFELSLIAARYRGLQLYSFFTALNRDVSLLHPDVLALLYHFAGNCASPVLELGPYMGGSTIAIARGLADSGSSFKVISVEQGGSFDHVTHSTPDIVASFRDNLGKYGLAAQSELVVGHSRDEASAGEVARLAGAARFACLVIDTDGEVEGDIRLYGPLLSPGAFFIVDDYYAPGNPAKEATTRREIDQLVGRGVVEPFGVHGWGTWFGRFR